MHLFFRHVHTNNTSILTNQLTEDKTVHARTTAEVQYARALQSLRGNQTTSIVSNQTNNITLEIYSYSNSSHRISLDFT